MTTSDRVEKWKQLSPTQEKRGAIVPFGLDPSDDSEVVHADEDWLAQSRPGYVDPHEVMTDDDLKKIDE